MPLLLSLAAVLPASAPAHADESPVAWVGRVSAVDGNLSIKPQNGDWADSAVVNDPIAAGMAVRTSAKGKATLRIGPETIVLAPGTELAIGQLDSSGSQFTLKQGRAGVRLASTEPALSIEIDSPRGGVWVLAPGDYDIAAGDDRIPGRVAAFDGRVRIVGKGLDRIVTTGSAVELNGNDPVAATLSGAAADDFVTAWRSASPDTGSDGAPQPLGYVSAEMTGYDALEGNGSWETVKDVGPAWFPKNVSADWAPYRAGHWRWMAVWGWTWIDDAAWGFAPSHYGRWAHLAGADGERWGWVPGSLVQHPVYMPAAVAFLGTAGVGISYADAFAPAVAWFPLAPGEAYWPRYTKDADAIRRVNVGVVADLDAIKPEEDGGPPESVINGEYRNRTLATAVPRTVFLAAKPVAPALVLLPEPRLKNAPLLAGSPLINPAPPAPVAVASNAGRGMIAMQNLARLVTPQPASARTVVLGRAAAARLPVVVAVAKQRALAFRRLPPRFVAVNVVRSARPVTMRPATMRFAAATGRRGSR